MYKITNLTNEPRKFRIHKTAEAFFIRAGETLIVPYKPITVNTHIFKIELDNEEKTDKIEQKKTKIIGGK